MKYSSMAIQASKKFKLVSRELDKVNSEELIVKVKGCYICGSDLKTINFGNHRVSENRIMGHEISGTIIQVGDKVRGFKVGENVALGADFPCLNCNMCFKKDYSKCLNHLALGHEIDGGFSEYITLPSPFVKKGPIIKINDNIPLTLAALSEPVGCCLRSIKNYFYLKKLSSITVIGGGPMGAILTTVLSIKFPSIKINVFEPNTKRRKLLKSKEIGNYWYEDTKIFKDNAAGDLIFVACSVPEAQSEALRIVNHGGTICLFGGINKSINVPIIDSNMIHYKELCVYGTTGSNKDNVKEALTLISKNQVQFEKIFSEKFPLNSLEKAFKVAGKGNKLKIFVECC